MAGSSTRKVCRIKKDRISELPRNIQETILGFLPMRDAVRTSILSTKWRHCWTMIPNLIFDVQTVDNMMDKFIKFNHSDLMAHKFACVINKALLLHNGQIDTFSLKFPVNGSSQIIHDYIDQWIPLLSRKGIKKLTLEKTSLQDSNAHHFSSLNLTHLKLTCVQFLYTPAIGRFSYLTILELVDATDRDATDRFRKSIFDCPVLEKLTLILCKGLFPNNFCAPNLKCLHQVCHDMTLKYSIAGFENLAEYSLLLTEDLSSVTKTSNLVKVLDGVHKLEKFSIAMNGIKYLAAGGSPNRLAKPLTCLKTLSISCINFKNLSEVSCLLCLIRSAPNLCKLNISADQDAETESKESDTESDTDSEDEDKLYEDSDSDSDSDYSESDTESDTDSESEDEKGNLKNYSNEDEEGKLKYYLIEDPEDFNIDSDTDSDYLESESDTDTDSDTESEDEEGNLKNYSNKDVEGNLKNYSIEDPEDFNIDQLENVTFSYFKGLKAEFELVKFLLFHSPSLKTMFIHRSERIKEGVALMMAEQMLQYSRASSRAQIRPLKYPIEVDEFDQELWEFYKISRYH